jgi:hypothetical protein
MIQFVFFVLLYFPLLFSALLYWGFFHPENTCSKHKKNDARLQTSPVKSLFAPL